MNAISRYKTLWEQTVTNSEWSWDSSSLCGRKVVRWKPDQPLEQEKGSLLSSCQCTLSFYLNVIIFEGLIDKGHFWVTCINRPKLGVFHEPSADKRLTFQYKKEHRYRWKLSSMLWNKEGLIANRINKGELLPLSDCWFDHTCIATKTSSHPGEDWWPFVAMLLHALIIIVKAGFVSKWLF